MPSIDHCLRPTNHVARMDRQTAGMFSVSVVSDLHVDKVSIVVGAPVINPEFELDQYPNNAIEPSNFDAA